MGRQVKLADPQTVLRIYYSNPAEIGNKEIRELFGGVAIATAVRYKQMVQKEMVKQEIRTWNKNSVNTKLAFEVWGIDISAQEKCLNKLKKLETVNK